MSGYYRVKYKKQKNTNKKIERNIYNIYEKSKEK